MTEFADRSFGGLDAKLVATRRFYALLDALAGKHGGPRLLGDATGRMTWPRRGVYFFFEPGETRSGSGSGLRVVRIGTHALRAGSQSSLWGRLSHTVVRRAVAIIEGGVQAARRAGAASARPELGHRDLG